MTTVGAMYIYYEYDDLGRLASTSQPTLTSSPSQWVTYTYDEFDRLVEKEYPDEHVDTYSYSGLSTTSTIDGVTSTRTFDESGNLVEVNDGGGRIEYTLRPDGQPSEIRMGGSIATTFGYDQYGRRTSINDPSAGCRTTTYDSNGNVQCETDARGKSVTSVYNEKGLLTSRTFSDGLSVTFAYDKWNAPTSMTGSNGHSKTWTYNDQRRLSTEIIDGFKKTYSYTGDQLSSVAYFKNNSHICSENHNHSNGHLTSITLNTGDTIWTLRKQNSRFLPTKVGLGKLQTSLSYDLRGNVSNRRTVFCVNNTNTTKQDIAYTYDPETGNMSSRLDWLTMLRESFGYDGMNRLTDISLYDGMSCLSELETHYDGKGNILSRADAGQYVYDPSLPYGINELTSPGTSIPMRDQYLHFNAMQLPDTICENGYTATFDYYGDKTRAAMVVTGPEAYRFECEYYDQQYNEFSKTVGNVTSYKSVLWLGGSPYSAPAALLKDYGESNWQLVHVLRDNLGSITHVIDTTGIVLQELAYTAWGQLRDPLTASIYGPDNQPELLLGRGYTGHEHLPWFGLINMNARLYDPAVGRFLSPDPIIQTPDNTQNFNRYSYCLNNPLKYTDSDGEFFLFTIFNAITDLFINITKHGFNVSQYNWKRTVNAWKMDMGWFKGSFRQIVSRFLWEIPQTYLGYLAGNISNTFDLVTSVSYYGGATAIEYSTSNWGAFTLGCFINGSSGLYASPYNSKFQHEYGHYLQSQSVGPIYLIGYAIPSLVSATINDYETHNNFCIEKDANRRAYNYFMRNEPGFKHDDWDDTHPIDPKWLKILDSNHLNNKNNSLSLQLNDYSIVPIGFLSSMFNTDNNYK